MILDFEQIKSITCGAVDVAKTDDGYIFRRFTEEQTKYYAIYRVKDLIGRALTSAGVRMAFETDSKSLSFRCFARFNYAKNSAHFDVYADGAMINHFGIENTDGELCVSVPLKDGKKLVEIYFPWSKEITVSEILIDDGAVLIPAKRRLTMINYGDSITHGYDSEYPSLSYASRLARMLDADSFNKAVGGDRFFPELLELPENIDPDIVTVAYGINDWYCHSRATIARRSYEFFSRLSKKFPKAKIFVISPIWTNSTSPAKFDGPPTDVHAILAENCEDIGNITVISGWDLTPHQLPFYTDGLHPNDLGMGIYAENLYREIVKHL